MYRLLGTGFSTRWQRRRDVFLWSSSTGGNHSRWRRNRRTDNTAYQRHRRDDHRLVGSCADSSTRLSLYVDTSDSSDNDYTSMTQVDFDAVQHNIGGHFSLTANKFTAPVSGVYQFNWQVRVYNIASATSSNTSLRINGNYHWGNDLYIYGRLEDPQGGAYMSPGTSVTASRCLMSLISPSMWLATCVSSKAIRRYILRRCIFSGLDNDRNHQGRHHPEQRRDHGPDD